MARLAWSGVETEMICLLACCFRPSPSLVMVPMKTRTRWSMLAPTWNHMEAVTMFSPDSRAKRPVSRFMPLNWACEAMRSTSSTSEDTSTWICMRSSSA